MREQLAALLLGTLGGQGAKVAFIWHPSGPLRFVFWKALQSLGWNIAQEIIWHKSAFVFGRADYQWQHEPCFYAKKSGAPRLKVRTESTVWEIAKPSNPTHPTMKPVELFARSVRNHTRVGDLCFDPFGGSGTLAIACETENRRARLVELRPEYVAITLERLAQMGLEPRLQESP